MLVIFSRRRWKFLVWSWEGCSAHTRTAGLPCCRSNSSEQGTETFTAVSISKVCGKCLCFTFSLSHSLKDCETHKWLMHVGTKSGSPEGGEQKVHHGHQRLCPGRKPLSSVLQNLLALPCVEQSSRLAARWKKHFFPVKEFLDRINALSSAPELTVERVTSSLLPPGCQWELKLLDERDVQGKDREQPLPLAVLHRERRVGKEKMVQPLTAIYSSTKRKWIFKS